MLKHLRIPNLIMMAYLMISIRYFLMAPIIKSHDLHFILSNLDFAALVLSWLMVAAAGYLINDYYDQAADLINKPHIALKKPNAALNLYFAFNLIGIALSIFVGWQAGLMNLAIILVIVVFLLWKYAEAWKGIALLGNLVIALLLAILVFVPIIHEYIAISVLYKQSATAARYLIYAGLAYATFAYLTTLVRELAKTMEDIDGDQTAGYNTLPIRYGVVFTRRLAVIIQILTLLLLTAFLFFQLQSRSWYVAAYILIAVLIPGLLALVKLIKASSIKDFRAVSRQMKWFMLGGISSLVFFYLELQYF
jgi:4-hydroxybenzoate polyprenyltransferase